MNVILLHFVFDRFQRRTRSGSQQNKPIIRFISTYVYAPVGSALE